MTARRRILLAFLVCWLMAEPASGGVLRGVLHVPAPKTSTSAGSAYPGRAGSLPGSRPLVRGAASDAVISIDRIPESADSLIRRSNAHPMLVQRNQAFAPRVLAIAVGTVVDFPNQDPIYHNVFSVSPTRRFDLGKYARGKSKSVVFQKAGLVNVYCDIHSDMAAYILVLPNHAFTQPTEDGAFELPSLPPGTYTLNVWHPDLGTFQKDVRVPADGSVSLDLAY